MKNHTKFRFLQYKPAAVRMLLAALVLPLLLATHAQLAWGGWPAGGGLVSPNLFENPDSKVRIVSDDDGGAILVWEFAENVYAQRIGRFGDPIWSSEFSTIGGSYSTYWPDLAADGNGGAFLAWHERRIGWGNFAYAQHLTADGISLWNGDASGGVRVEGGGVGVRIVTNETGDPFVAWHDGDVILPRLQMQRLGTAGEPMWGSGPLIIGNGTWKSMVPDGSDGVLVGYADSEPLSSRYPRGERVDHSGNALWGDIATGWAYGTETDIVSDGQGGAISASMDLNNWNLRLHRTNASGGLLWGSSGIKPFFTLGSWSTEVQLISDRQGGALVVMTCRSSPYYYNIYINRVREDGSVAWEQFGGVEVCTVAGPDSKPQMAPDGFGGAYVVWQDGRNDLSNGSDIYAQHIDANGVPQWAAGGVAVCTQPLDQRTPRITRTGSHDAIVAWFDDRNGPFNPDLYAQKLHYNGAIGNPGLFASTFDPPINAIDVSRTTDIRVDFSGKMLLATMNSSTITVHGSIGGLYDMAYSMPFGLGSLLMQPAAPFVEGEVVTVTLTNGIESNVGFLPATTWSFTVTSAVGVALFPAAVSNVVQDSPTALHAADINGDGHTDLIVANVLSNTISMLRGNGDGSFYPQVDYATGAAPVSLLATDFDLDGDLDVAVVNRDDATLSVFSGRGDSSGRLLTPVTYATGVSPRTVCSGDFDSDGYLDLATADKGSDGFSLLLNDQVGGFLPAVAYAAGNGTTKIAGADLNNDGHLDIVCTNLLANSASIFLNLGSGVFADATHILGINAPRSVYCADTDGDGDLDVVIAVPDAILLLRNRGDATFPDPVVLYGGTTAQGTRPADVDGDGLLDLIDSDIITDKVMVHLNDGAGSFYRATIFSTGNGPEDLVTADFDGDGELDIATANRFGDDVSILLNGAIASATPPTPVLAATQLLSNVPNPFNPRTKIKYSIAHSGNVHLAVYDLRGALVNTLVDGPQNAGMQLAFWDGRDESGDAMPSGIYFYRLNTGEISTTRRMTLLK